jgi:AraC family transcriptional regulator of arabinose operon
MNARPECLVPAGSMLLTGHFTKGNDYSTRRPQGSADWLIIDTVAGAGSFGSPRGRFTVQAGDVVLLRPGHPHDYGTDTAAGTWELAWAHLLLPDSWLDLVEWPEPRPGLLHLHLDASAHAAVTACLDLADGCCRRALAHRERLAGNALERALLLLAQANPNQAGASCDPRLRAAMDLGLRNLAAPAPLDALARAADMSVSRFAHLFRAQVGTSPGRWLEGERLRRAAALLDATMRPVAAVAAEVGFADPFYFSQRFRRWSGRSPRAWRRRRR